MRGILLAGVASAMALLAVFVPAARAADAWPEWSAFATRFIQDDGRVIDLTFDGSGHGLGTRSRRYSMLVEDGVVKSLNIEEAPGKVEVSGGDALLKQL